MHRSRTLGQFAVAVVAALAVAPAGADAAQRTLRDGDGGRGVRALNARLAELGYLPPSAVSDTFDARTRHAVIALQKWEGLSRDGIVGPRTTARLKGARRPTPTLPGRTGTRIEVLYRQQLALLIRRGVVVRTIAVSTGADGYRTPPGAFRVFRKELRSWSVPYRVWLPFASYFYRGVAFHAWREVPAYPASHGCVRVPEPFAKEVYAFARAGTRVDVVYPPAEIGGDESPLGPYGP